jgi:HEAT repeat protein
MTGLTYFCWRCYGANPAPDVCVHCGEPVAEPAGTPHVERLLWALRHPLVERRMVAIDALASLSEPAAVEPLRALANSADDPYLAARALDALVAIAGAGAVWPMLVRLAEHGAAPVRAAARRALAGSG